MSETSQPKNPIPLQPIEKIRTNLISRVATTHTLTSDASSRSCQDSSLQNYDIKFTASAWGLKATPCSDGSRIEGCLFSWEAQVKAIILAELVSGAVYLRLVFLSLNGFFSPLHIYQVFYHLSCKAKNLSAPVKVQLAAYPGTEQGLFGIKMTQNLSGWKRPFDRIQPLTH